MVLFDCRHLDKCNSENIAATPIGRHIATQNRPWTMLQSKWTWINSTRSRAQRFVSRFELRARHCCTRAQLPLTPALGKHAAATVPPISDLRISMCTYKCKPQTKLSTCRYACMHWIFNRIRRRFFICYCHFPECTCKVLRAFHPLPTANRRTIANRSSRFTPRLIAALLANGVRVPEFTHQIPYAAYFRLWLNLLFRLQTILRKVDNNVHADDAAFITSSTEHT